MGKMFRFFKRIFSKKQESKPVQPKAPVENPTDKPIESPTGTVINKKIAILVGHGAGDSGAICYNGLAEHEYNKKVSEIVKARLPNVAIYFKSSVGGWAPVYARLALYRPDLSVELHLNAYNGKAFGCEVLITNEVSRSVAEAFASMFCKKFNRTMRGAKGVKWLGSGDRGFGNVYSANKASKKSILVEPFFCDNKNEWIPVEEYSESLITFLIEFNNNWGT